MFTKKSFQNANIFATILFIFGVAACSAQIIGNYTKAEEGAVDSKTSTNFVMRTAASDVLKWRLTENVETTVIAGLNYRLSLAAKSSGEKQQPTVVIHRNLPNNYGLINREDDNCTNNDETIETQDESSTFSGKLQVGKTNSTILYLGEESGDYAGFCFTNASAVGRKILAACKNGEQCEFTGKINYESKCKIPGLEASLSAEGKILSVSAVKSLSKKNGTKKKRN